MSTGKLHELSVKAAIVRLAAVCDPHMSDGTIRVAAREWAEALPLRGVRTIEQVHRAVSYARAWWNRPRMPTIPEFVTLSEEAERVFESSERLRAPRAELPPPADLSVVVPIDRARLMREAAVAAARVRKRVRLIESWRLAQVANGVPEERVTVAPPEVLADDEPSEQEVAQALEALERPRTRAESLPAASRRYRAAAALRREQTGALDSVPQTTATQERAAVQKWPHLRKVRA